MNKALLEEIIHRYKYPKRRGQVSGRALRAENLSCGDIIAVQLDIQNGLIKSAKYDGQLCSIANFGADLLLDQLIGQPLAAASQINSAQLLGESGQELLQNPVRLKCFELAQLALKNSP
jgi:nitrogen fixation NifU-like protein